MPRRAVGDRGMAGTLPHAFRTMTICSSMYDFDCFHPSLGYDSARSVATNDVLQQSIPSWWRGDMRCGGVIFG
jgi:hypothetical protein